MSEDESKGESVESQENKYKPVIVEVGYDGEARKVRFKGEELAERTNKSFQGPNSNRWHTWTLYEVAPGKYRVLDEYTTCWQGECGANRLSEPLDALTVVKRFPRFAADLGDEAIEDVDSKGEVDGSAEDEPANPDEN